MYQRIHFIFIICLLSSCAYIERLAIPSKFTKHQTLISHGKTNKIETKIFQDFFKKYLIVNENKLNLVNYKNVTNLDKQLLKAFIQDMEQIKIHEYKREDQLAFWINLYNAKTIDVILDHYPVESIRDIKSHWFDLGPWNEKRLKVLNIELSLHDIEHGILRSNWNDIPEIHYGLNCASMGCPEIYHEVFQGDKVLTQLSMAAKNFFKAKHSIKWVSDESIEISKIFNWYREDFGSNSSALLDHIKKYLPESKKERITTETKITGFFYDWSLNE